MSHTVRIGLSILFSLFFLPPGQDFGTAVEDMMFTRITAQLSTVGHIHIFHGAIHEAERNKIMAFAQLMSRNRVQSATPVLILILRTSKPLEGTPGQYFEERLEMAVLRECFSEVLVHVLPEFDRAEAESCLSEGSFHPLTLPAYDAVVQSVAGALKASNTSRLPTGPQIAETLIRSWDAIAADEPLDIPSLRELLLMEEVVVMLRQHVARFEETTAAWPEEPFAHTPEDVTTAAAGPDFLRWYRTEFAAENPEMEARVTNAVEAALNPVTSALVARLTTRRAELVEALQAAEATARAGILSPLTRETALTAFLAATNLSPVPGAAKKHTAVALEAAALTLTETEQRAMAMVSTPSQRAGALTLLTALPNSAGAVARVNAAIVALVLAETESKAMTLIHTATRRPEALALLRALPGSSAAVERVLAAAVQLWNQEQAAAARVHTARNEATRARDNAARAAVVPITKTVYARDRSPKQGNACSDEHVNLWKECPEAFGPGGPATIRIYLKGGDRIEWAGDASTARGGGNVMLDQTGGFGPKKGRYICTEWHPSTGTLYHHDEQRGFGEGGWCTMIGLKHVNVTYMPPLPPYTALPAYQSPPRPF